MTAIVFGVGLALVSARGNGPPNQALVPAVMVSLILIWAGTAAFGITVGIGLMRLRNWARISAILWAVVMVFCAVLAFAIAAAVTFSKLPGPPTTSPIFVSAFFSTVGVASILVGAWWLILFTRKSVSAQFSVTAEADPIPVSREPFSFLKGRIVLGGGILAVLLLIVAFVFVLLIGRISTGRFLDIQSPLVLSFVMVSFYGFQLLMLLYLLRRAGLKPAVLVGASLNWNQLRGYRSLPVLLVGVSLAGYFLLFFPLSYAMPGWIDRYLFQQRPTLMIHSSGFGYPLANILNMLVVVWFGPIVEEFFFRGILLTRWSIKWGAPRAIFLSSTIFGLLHREVIGHIFFGYVMAVLYIETKSLYAPILMHIANNGIAWAFSTAAVVWGAGTKSTLLSFQSSWPFNIALSLVFIPWAVWFTTRHVPKSSWKIPYAEFRENESQQFHQG